MFIASLLAVEHAEAADLSPRIGYFKKVRRVASLERVSYVTGDCRLGWWQGARANHVFPRWAVRCR
jgi:hypothetical protein